MTDWMAERSDDDMDFGALLAEAEREIAICGGQHDCPCGTVVDDVPLVCVDVDGLRHPHARALRCVGNAWLMGVESDVYVVAGVCCHRDVGTGAVWYEDGTPSVRVRVQQPVILRAIERLAAHDCAVWDACDALLDLEA